MGDRYKMKKGKVRRDTNRYSDLSDDEEDRTRRQRRPQAADYMTDREGSQSSYVSGRSGYRSDTPADWEDRVYTDDETMRARKIGKSATRRSSDDESDDASRKTVKPAAGQLSREGSRSRKRDRGQRSKEEVKETKRQAIGGSRDSRSRRSVSCAGGTPPALFRDRKLSIPRSKGTDKWADDDQPPMTSAQAKEDEAAWQYVESGKQRRHRERKLKAASTKAAGEAERRARGAVEKNPAGARQGTPMRHFPNKWDDTPFNRDGWRRQGDTMVNKRGDIREMNNDERRQYAYQDKGKKEFRRPELPTKGKATVGQPVKDAKGRQNQPPPSQTANQVKTSTPVQTTQGLKRQHAQGLSDKISPIQPKVRAMADEEMDYPTVVDRPSGDPNFWELGSTKMMTARVVPTHPHLDGSELDSKDISYLSSHYVEATDEVNMPDIDFVRELDDREIGVSCGVIRICMKKCEQKHIDWWRNFISSVPARVKDGTKYKFLAPGEEEECVFKVKLRDARFGNPDKSEIERIIRSNWRRSPIMEAKFRMRIGRFVEQDCSVVVWLYFEKSQNTQKVLKDMKYTVQYGLERFLLQRATRLQSTIDDGDMTDKAGDKVQTKSAPNKSPIKRFGHWDDDDNINLESQLVQSLLNPSDGETSEKGKTKKRQFGEKQVTEAIAKALSTHANEGTSEEGIRSVASNVFEAVKNTMEVIANDFGGDLDGQDWDISENDDNDLDKVVDKVTEMSTWTEGDMDTRQPSSNPLIGPAEQRQDQGAYVPPSLDTGEVDEEPADQDMLDQEEADDEATLKQ